MSRVAISSLFGVCLGGAVGSGLRYLLALAMERPGGRFHYGTLAANLLGCFAMGLLATIFAVKTSLPLPLRLGLTTGLLGGFTTYSTFSVETLSLFQKNGIAAGVAYASATLLGSILAATAGFALARAVVGSPA